MSAGFTLGPRAEPPPVLLVVGTLAHDDQLAQLAVEQLGESWGGIDLWGESAPFDRTSYYEPEMGQALRRRYCSFGRLAPAQQLGLLKQRSWLIEQRFMCGSQRQVNLDPGYLDATKLVLASFKPGPHKLYIGEGVWADLVLFYRDGAFGPLPWTFPDLRGAEHRPFFQSARIRYKSLLRELRR